MTLLRTRLLVFCVWVNMGFFATATVAQERWEVGGFVGTSGYLGDLNKSNFFSKEPRPAFGAILRYRVSPYLSLRLSLLHGRLSGRDDHYADRAFRNFTTTSPANELATQLELNLWPLADSRNPRDFQPQFTPYLFLGFGVVATNPVVDLDNMIITKTEYAEGAEIDRTAIYSNFHAIVPFGLGVKYRFHRQWTLAAEASFRFAFSDYLDGISFAGNPNKSDRYKFSGITLSYRFKKLATRCVIDF